MDLSSNSCHGEKLECLFRLDPCTSTHLGGFLFQLGYRCIIPGQEALLLWDTLELCTGELQLLELYQESNQINLRLTNVMRDEPKIPCCCKLTLSFLTAPQFLFIISRKEQEKQSSCWEMLVEMEVKASLNHIIFDFNLVTMKSLIRHEISSFLHEIKLKAVGNCF